MNELFESSMGYIGMGPVLIKADKKHKDIIYIEASNQLTDSQNDVVLQKALKEESDNFLRKGIISYDHLHKVEKNPKYIIGEPLAASFPSDGRTLVKAKIYSNNEYGNSILKLAQAGSTRLGASVGGGILKRNKVVDNLNKAVSAIVKVLWDEVAVTYQPVNEATLGNVSYMPFGEFQKSFMTNDIERAEELKKALEAGYGTDHVAFGSGRSIIEESLMGTKKHDLKLVDAFKTAFTSIRDKKVNNYKDLLEVLDDRGLVGYSRFVAKTIADNISKIKNNL